MKKIGFLLYFYLHFAIVFAQPLRFAHVTDLHVGSSTSSEDLLRTINDINSQSDIDFVLLTGDITEFGSDKELTEAKKIISQLDKPWYIVPGNHDSKWSESGCNSFVKIFGAEQFCFESKGFLFIGTASGPNMRMGPGLIPHEQMVFIDSVLVNMKDKNQPIVFVNHYPLDESLANSSLVIEKLKTRNIQATLLGHGHRNKLFDFSGIPGIMGRSNLRAKDDVGGYNIATIESDTLYYNERVPGRETLEIWCKVPIENKRFSPEINLADEQESMLNATNPNVKIDWEFQDKSDIGTGIVTNGRQAVYANTAGEIIVVSASKGKVFWKYQTGGKIYSTPWLTEKQVICPSTDGCIYSINLKTGKLIWKFETEKSIVASPVVDNGTVFCGASDGVFRAIDLNSGKLIWSFSEVYNFVESRALVYGDGVYFGSWGNTFYALDRLTGKLIWKREKYSNRMLSPAAVWPVASAGKIFIVAPDRRMTALDAKTGEEIWDSGEYSCRESIGISNDGKLVYIKNMTEGNVDAFYTETEKQELAWECKAELGYEISPSPITENDKLIFVPTALGEVCAIDKKSHLLLWKYKASNALINGVTPLGKDRMLITTLDGKVCCLKFGGN